MSGLILLPSQQRQQQPQYNAPIDYEGLGKGMRLLLNPALGQVDLVTGRVWTANGDAKTEAVQRGKIFRLDGSGDYFTHTGYPEITSNVGTFFIWCPQVGPSGGNGQMFLAATSPGIAYHMVSPASFVYFGGVAGSGTTLSTWFNTTNRSLVLSCGGTAATSKAYADGADSKIVFGSAPAAWGAGNKNFRLGAYPTGGFWDFSGTIRIVGHTDAVWGAAEAKAFHENPWQIFKAPPRKLFFVASGGDTVTGTVAYTNLDDSSSATGTATVQGSGATTNADDTGAAAGTTAVTGTSAATNANDTASATGSPVIVGTSATTNADDTAAASGSVGSEVTGTVAYTNADDTASASGTTEITGSTSASNANDTASAAGTTTITGSSAATNANDLCAASGTVEATEITGTVAYTNANDTSAAAGATTVKGSAAASNINDTASAFGTVNNGIVVETALTTGIVSADRIKKPGIPTGTADWLKTFLEIIVGRRGNKIAVPALQELTFSATPTQAECEALYAYTNKVRTAVNEIITRLDS